MQIEIKPNGLWYHGSNVLFDVLEEGSTITQWKELAEAFSHQPKQLGYDDDGTITHNGTEKGFLFVIDEPIKIDIDISTSKNRNGYKCRISYKASFEG